MAYIRVTNDGDGLNHYYLIVYYKCEKFYSTFRKVYECFDSGITGRYLDATVIMIMID